MRHAVTGTQMKEIDRYTMEEIGIPSMVLMERAALCTAEAVKREAGKSDRIWVVCGTGNNGADGIAVARMLFLDGFRVVLILVGNTEHGTAEYHMQKKIAEGLELPIFPFQDFIPGRCDVLVDALFGVGLSREIGGEYRECMEMLLEQSPKRTVAVDIPSGIHADTGAVMGIALRADVTVTFGYEKLGTLLYPGKGCAGQVLVRDIGFPESALDRLQPEVCCYEDKDLAEIPVRKGWSNKGTYGKILLIAGSRNMSGAAYLSALAAYRMGSGLVKIMTVKENRVILQEQMPEAILAVYDPEAATAEPERFGAFIKSQCDWADCIVLGPGLGREAYVESLVEQVLTNAYVPIVVDADGLNTIAANPHLTQYYTENIIITPHLGEMARLTGLGIEEIRKHPVDTAKDYASRYGITCVLKDAVTVVCRKDGAVFINTSGNSGMAKAGSGDVLTGVIAGLLALGLEEESASLGVYIHGLAGDEARNKRGSHGILAHEIADCIPDVCMRDQRRENEYERV